MASDSRALTLKLLADTADFQKKLAAGSKDIDSIGERAAEFGKKAAIAFAAAGAAIGAFAVSAVKAAAEDEAAQLKLAETIRATTGATDAQIKGVERYITQTSIAAGITDDQLRPAFSRLVRSTNDVEEAQKLLNLALDLSAATGKPLETVTNALGKAYDGNTTALGKLGTGIDEADLKSQDFDTTFQQLTTTFGNFSENEAQSTQKQMERVKIALDEAKESIGAALLPVVQELTAWILENFIPALEAFIMGLTGSDGLTDGFSKAQTKAFNFGKKVNDVINTVVDLKDELLILAGVIATVFVVSKVAAAVTATIALITSLIRAYNLLKGSAIVAGVASAFALNPLLGAGAAAVGFAALAAISASQRQFDTATPSSPSGAAIDTAIAAAASGSGITVKSGRTARNTGVSSGLESGSGSNFKSTTATQTLIEQVSEANFIKRIAGTGSFDLGGFRRGEESDRIVININGAIDPASTARQIADLLNNEASVSGSFNNLGVSRFANRAG